MGAPDSGQLLTALTTEHFTLQGARSQAMSETSARASVYMYSVSSALVALGFVSQVADGFGAVFAAFAFTVLPTIYFLGCTTYVRLVELGAENLRYGVAINRIRGYYKELAEGRADLFLMSGHDDAAGVFTNMGLAPEVAGLGFRHSRRVLPVHADFFRVFLRRSTVSPAAVGTGAASRSVVRLRLLACRAGHVGRSGS